MKLLFFDFFSLLFPCLLCLFPSHITQLGLPRQKQARTLKWKTLAGRCPSIPIWSVAMDKNPIAIADRITQNSTSPASFRPIMMEEQPVGSCELPGTPQHTCDSRHKGILEAPEKDSMECRWTPWK
ncbi:hypothetical protein H6P81_003229 [Aristolochia fimbriata]|uniref:Uncharacterized protein n=1 Tax=Aristolochia fimbriata TaxID=158543 RepID=A0AAV7FD28_ARIFI|nr:hypothetical protein H6P81_003229 [Aristolochia fimbriata]